MDERVSEPHVTHTGQVVDLAPGALCKQCASEGYTCCQPEYGVTLSLHDARRLIDATGLELHEFASLNSIEDDELVEGLKIDPWFRKLFIGKDRLLQTIQHDLDCHFLGPQGCTVFADRPRLCHLHPFWFLEDDEGRLRFEFDAVDDEDERDEAECLVVNHLWPDMRVGFRSIGEDDATLGLHARQMMDEIAWQHEQIQGLKAAGKKPSKLTLADLAELVDQVPRFEV